MAAVVVTGFSAASARRALGRPFPSFLVDPYGYYSTVELPSWGLDAQARPGRVIAIEGEALGAEVAYGDFPADRLERGLAARRAAGHDDVRLSVLRGSEPVEVRYPIRAIGPREVWFFFGVYALSGWFVLWSGVVVAFLAGRREGGQAYTFWSAGTFLFLVTLFDYHTTRWLTPLFAVSTTWAALGFGWLAYTFPEPPPRPSRALRAGASSGVALAALAAAYLMLAPAFGRSARAVQAFIPIPALLALLALAGSMALRLRSASGRARAELRSAAWGLLLVPIFFVLAIALGLTQGSGLLHLTLPFVVFAIPAAVGYSLVRHNILATTAVLSRTLLAIPVGAFSLIVAPLVTLGALELARRRGVEQAAPIVTGVVIFFALFALGRRGVQRAFFPASSEFRPTIEQLSDQLASLRDRRAVRDAVENVTRWLSTRDVQLIGPRELEALDLLPPDGVSRIRSGQIAWTLESPWRRRLLVPMRSLGELRGVLLIAPKHQAALYNSEDLALLQTIASLGALALHTIEVLEQIEALRRLEVDAARGEKSLTLEMLSAELSHEIAYPLNYFRFLLKRAERGRPLGEQDVAIGQEEVERLQRMLATLRKLKPPPLKLGPVRVAGPLHRALDLLREPLSDQRISFQVEVPDDLTVVADHDPLLQMFANLLRNAIQAVAGGGCIGVRSFEEGGATILEVWDTGAGVPEEVQATLFDPWVTAKEGGLGLGLAVTQRIVLAFGWTISFAREDERTCFRIRVPLPAAARSAAPREEP